MTSKQLARIAFDTNRMGHMQIIFEYAIVMQCHGQSNDRMMNNKKMILCYKFCTKCKMKNGREEERERESEIKTRHE